MYRKWLRRSTIAGVALVLAVFAAFLAGKYWLIPFVLRQQISAALYERWDGKLTIGAINFNWTSPSYLQGVELRDATGRKWLGAGSVKLTARDWPGLHPVLSEMEVDNLDLHGYFADGAFHLPLKPAPPQMGGNNYIDLSAVTIHNMSIGITSDQNELSSWGDLQLGILRDGQSYSIDLKRLANKPGESLVASGTVDGSALDTDLNVVMQHTIAQKEAAAILAMLTTPFVTQAAGKLDLKLDLHGRLSEFPAPSAIRISGAIGLTDGSVACARGPFMRGLSGEVRFDGQAPLSAAGEWSATFCKGLTKGELSAKIQDDGTLGYRCKVDAQGVSFDEMSKLLSGSQETRRGELQFIYIVAGHIGDRGETAGRGYLYLEDAGLADVPLLTGLFHVAGLTQLEALQATDVEAAFTMKGRVVTLSQTRLANAIAAVDIEPGGQVDFERHSLDLYAIVAPIKQVSDLLASIPFMTLVVKLKDRLTRVHIQGDWNAPPESLISKESLQDITEGTVDFLRGVVSSGGRLGKSLYNEIGERFDP